ncbi:MAG: hypothetical protein RL737_2300, partial [Bacteroidota bacterium]
YKHHFFYTPLSPYPKATIDSFSTFFRESLIVNPSNFDSVRNELKLIVFGNSLLPSRLPDSVGIVTDERYGNLLSLQKIEKFKIKLEHGFISIGYIFHPKKSNNRLIIYHRGHGGDFILGKKEIDVFLDRGYTVYAFSMPLLGFNNQPKIHIPKLGTINFSSNHDFFRFLPNPLSYYLTPVISMINYASTKSFKSVSAVGFSGGGWVVTIAAAMDERINYSFPIAATYPMAIRFLRPEKNYGDFEQVYQPLFSKLDYTDLYVLGAVGKDRCQIQIFNLNDPCCFDGYEYQFYDEVLKSEVKKYMFGDFRIFSDSTNYDHSISSFSLNLILNTIGSKSK